MISDVDDDDEDRMTIMVRFVMKQDDGDGYRYIMFGQVQRCVCFPPRHRYRPLPAPISLITMLHRTACGVAQCLSLQAEFSKLFESRLGLLYFSKIIVMTKELRYNKQQLRSKSNKFITHSVAAQI